MAKLERRTDLVVANGRPCGACPRRAAEAAKRPQTAEARQLAEMTALMRDLLAAKRAGRLVASEAQSEWRVLVAPEVSAQPAPRKPANNTKAGGWVYLQAPEV